MTPTLLGRWQIRILLLFLVGLPVSAAFSWYYADDLPAMLPFHAVVALFVIGFLLDPVWIALQSTRWDQDWPFALQLVSTLIEFAIFLGVVQYGVLPFLDFELFDENQSWQVFARHFAFILVPSFMLLLGGFNVIFVRWRFSGGEIGKMRR